MCRMKYTKQQYNRLNCLFQVSITTKSDMNKLLCVLCIAILAIGCLKGEYECPYSNSTIVASASEEQAVQAYLSSNSLTATRHPSGMYYEIVTPGNGATPELCSQVVVGYTGKLTNGSVFDQESSTVYVLGSLISGLKNGLPLIRKGGQIKLYIPPSLGYGHTDVKDMAGNVIIPGNSILIFDVSLIDVL